MRSALSAMLQSTFQVDYLSPAPDLRVRTPNCLSWGKEAWVKFVACVLNSGHYVLCPPALRDFPKYGSCPQLTSPAQHHLSAGVSHNSVEMNLSRTIRSRAFSFMSENLRNANIPNSVVNVAGFNPGRLCAFSNRRRKTASLPGVL